MAKKCTKTPTVMAMKCTKTPTVMAMKCTKTMTVMAVKCTMMAKNCTKRIKALHMKILKKYVTT